MKRTNTPSSEDCDLCGLIANYGSWIMIVVGGLLAAVETVPSLATVGAYVLALGFGTQLVRTVYLLVRSHAVNLL